MSDNKMDPKAGHKFFSANCFNAVWGFLDKDERTPEENEKMIETAHASLYHWLERDDCTDENLSIGYWQISRVYSVVGDGSQATRYAEKCLAVSENLEPFCKGYSFEAAARAGFVSGETDAGKRFLEQAGKCLEEVSDPENSELLKADLEELEKMSSGG